MLNLELVRFQFSPVVTYGVMHSRDGWCCFAGESVVINSLNPPKGTAALPEGLYRVEVDSPLLSPQSIKIVEATGMPPVAHFTAGDRAARAGGNICVGYGLDTTAGTLSDCGEALTALYERILTNPEAFLSIRHLDNTQLLHFQRLASQAIQ